MSHKKTESLLNLGASQASGRHRLTSGSSLPMFEQTTRQPPMFTPQRQQIHNTPQAHAESFDSRLGSSGEKCESNASLRGGGVTCPSLHTTKVCKKGCGPSSEKLFPKDGVKHLLIQRYNTANCNRLMERDHALVKRRYLQALPAGVCNAEHGFLATTLFFSLF